MKHYTSSAGVPPAGVRASRAGTWAAAGAPLKKE
jgi:hypothetical protein